jgi:hypothetical protein
MQLAGGALVLGAVLVLSAPARGRGPLATRSAAAAGARA